MAFAFTANPPNYDDSSVVDDISSLISSALAVQAGFFNAKERLSRIDTMDVNNLLPRLVHTDEGYVELLNESRTSASELNIAVHSFLDVIIPISLDSSNTMEDRAGIVGEFADKISASGKKDFRYYDEKIEVLRENLNHLLADLISLENRQSRSRTQLTSQIPCDNADDNMDPLRALSYAIAKFGYRLLDATSPSATVDKAVSRDIQALVDLFSQLPGKLGHFDAIWERLAADASELNVFLSQGSSDQDVLGNRVQAEVGVYEKIMQALDDYSLRTRR